MGSLYTKCFINKKILILGLDDSGKTTFLYKLKTGQYPLTTVHTIGFNIEEMKYKDQHFVFWDAGGGPLIAVKQWEKFYDGTKGIIFFINSIPIERERTETDVKDEITKLLNEQNHLINCPILIFLNKQDLTENPLTVLELNNILDLPSSNKFQKKIHIQPCSVLNENDKGIEKGMKWFCEVLKDQ